MTHRILSTVLVAAGLCLAIAMPVQADVSAVQCCMLRDGKYVPGLRIDFGSRTVEVVLGEHGLDTTDLYRTDKVEAYIQSAFQTGNQEIAVSLNCGNVKGEETLVLAPPPTDNDQQERRETD